MSEEIINKVANSGLITLNLEDYYQEGERCFFDMKNHLFEELILKEKDFRAFVKTHDWSQYQNQYVAIGCTADAIIPIWAYMLVCNALVPFATKVVQGDLSQLESILFEEAIAKLNVHEFEDERIIIKGCSNKPVPEHACICLTQNLVGLPKALCLAKPVLPFQFTRRNEPTHSKHKRLHCSLQEATASASRLSTIAPYR